MMVVNWWLRKPRTAIEAYFGKQSEWWDLMACVPGRLEVEKCDTLQHNSLFVLVYIYLLSGF